MNRFFFRSWGFGTPSIIRIRYPPPRNCVEQYGTWYMVPVAPTQRHTTQGHELNSSIPCSFITDAQHLTFWRRSAAMTAELPWTSVGVATSYRGNSWVSTASATAHDTSTATATVVVTARAAVQSVANSFASIMATHGSSPLPRQFPRTSNRSNFHGHPWPSGAIAMAILRYAEITTVVRGYCHGTCRGSVRDKLRRTNHAHGSPWQLPRHFPRKLRTEFR